MVSILPFGALVIIVLSSYVLIKNIKQEDSPQSILYATLILNGLVFLFVSVFLIMYFRSPDIITMIHPAVYWLLISLGLLVGLISSIRTFIPGQLTSVGILFFMTFISIFSIGIVLYAMAIIQFILVWNHTRRYGFTN